MTLRKAALLAAAATAGAWYTSYQRGRSYGSMESERKRLLPGDEVVARPDIVTDHGVSIAAAPEDVWPWLLQMGWHRGGWYTHRWVDRLLFPANEPSADVVLPQYQDLEAGDHIPDGAPEANCYFLVHTLRPAELMVLHSTSHLPPALLGKPGVDLNWTWTFSLEPEGTGCTRFHFRSRIAIQPWWLRWAYRLFLVPADYVMAMSMCNGIKRRVENEKRRPVEGAAVS